MQNRFPGWNPVDIGQYTQSVPELNKPWIQSWQETVIGKIPVVHSRLGNQDRWGFLKMRWGMGRMKYTVPPGLYGIGRPSAESPVFVTANYKMTFDILRRDLTGLNGWILVLDTRGINVWCAAGKGTFGTRELIHRIRVTALERLLTHRELIVPQLGAVGIAAHKVKNETGFKVTYGPVRSMHISEFLENGKQCTKAMRKIRFSLADRLALIPMELIPALKYYPIVLLLFAVKTWILKASWSGVFLTDSVGFFGALITGTVLAPALLPWLPGRAFSFKGAFLGLLYALLWSGMTKADASG